MRSARFITPLVPWLLALASCSAPPKPPTVDGSLRRPVNSLSAVELQICRGDLQDSRSQAHESGRLAQANARVLAELRSRQQRLAAMQSVAGLQDQANRVFTVQFDFGSSRVAVRQDLAAALIDEARASPLILVRGRTDGRQDLPAESRMARARAMAVRDYLVAAGVDALRIRTTYQPAGDYVADNDSAGGRRLNRRVEVEVYRTRPVQAGLAAVAGS
ncbi:OmpA family protein [Roseateles saccharophilus]|uniref:Outer membrane protein OmpA-like peptidoglycan-associated protein n=1 Tax=Roseateles saccharophilus TaxID=304 RepID=A0A4R3UF94_ROSSA|nr:OmpA family protein [Roseateles saccharophilus]MDG0834864.1 OmpA family protein [Roseateles saccharophilus]TCU88398.1 outer membrane protein OmpA-like peptidoglycan-associated protein [Roseateles saccharophilus]